MKMGKIDKADLELTACPFDPEAEAMVLGEFGQLRLTHVTRIGWRYAYDYHLRIKVVTKEGLAQADQTVTLYEGDFGNREVFRSLKGYTYNLIDGKVELG
jgi:hypothetical protein